jgi:hypothetical protein
VPIHSAHPDPEELAVWQAGDLSALGGARIEAHLAGCVDCAGLVAAAEQGRGALAGLGEVEPPAGLHHRLATAIGREAGVPAGAGAREGGTMEEGADAQERRLAAAAGGDGLQGRRDAAAGNGDGLGESSPVAEPIPLDGRRRGRRPPAERRRIAVLSTAAAVILLVVGLVPLLNHLGVRTSGTQTAGDASRTAPGAGGSALAALPVFSAPDGYSGKALQSALAGDPATRSAYRRAAGPAPLAQPGTATPKFDSEGKSASPGASRAGGATQGSGGRAEHGPGTTAEGSGDVGAGASQAAGGLQQSTCVTNARTEARNQGLQPAFFVNPTTYRGRPATVLVTVRPGAPSHADLWAFPLGNCSAAPFAHEPVTVTPP